FRTRNWKEAYAQVRNGLNPLRIGEVLRTKRYYNTAFDMIYVSIPFASGKSFERLWPGDIVCVSSYTSQSPSHRGSLSHQERDCAATAGTGCLNPLRIGEVFRTIWEDSAKDARCRSVSIPFASGKSFAQWQILSLQKSGEGSSQSPSHRGTLSDIGGHQLSGAALDPTSQSPSHRGTHCNCPPGCGQSRPSVVSIPFASGNPLQQLSN